MSAIEPLATLISGNISVVRAIYLLNSENVRDSLYSTS